MLIAKKNSSKVISALLCLTLCITCFCAIPVYADEPVNLLSGKVATCTAGRATGTLSNLTDGKYNYRADGDVTCTYAHVTYGAYNSDTLAAHSAYFEYSFDEATRLNDVKLYLCSVETNQWARDVAIDVQLEDGTWQRVAADYNIKYSSSNVGGTYYEDSPVTQAYMEYKFAPVSCVKLRITSNRKRMRINKNLTGYTCVFRLAEIQAFYDPGITTYSGVERPDQADYAVPMELVNYAAGCTVTSKGTAQASNGFAHLTDGDKTNRAMSYYYNGTTTPTDAQCVNYYDITFAAEREIDRVDVIYSKYADDDRGHREQDIAIDAITADGGCVRVAEKHNFTAAATATNGSNYTLSLTFDAINAVGVRISANCRQTTRYTAGTYSSIFQVYAEAEVYNDPNVMSNTGIEAATVAGTVIPGYRSGNLALGGTVTSSNTNASLAENYPVGRLTNGYLSISSDCAIINYDGIFANYDIAFDSEKTINQIVLYLSQYEKEKLPVDLSVYVLVGDTWTRVAERHNVGYTDITNLSFNFNEVTATAFRVKATNLTNSNSTNFRLVEVGAYYDPNMTEEDIRAFKHTDINENLIVDSMDIELTISSLLGFESSCDIDVNRDTFSDIKDLVSLKKEIISN